MAAEADQYFTYNRKTPIYNFTVFVLLRYLSNESSPAAAVDAAQKLTSNFF